jgi:transaldolase
MTSVSELKIKLFADGADKKGILEMYSNPAIQGFTTNPTLMRKAGITDYQAFALDILHTIKDRSISFEVFADDFNEMETQAHQIASWGKNVMVKIPVTNTKGKFSGPLIKKLSSAGIPLNVTAILTLKQVQDVANCLSENTPAIVSVFAGRIADTGIDPLPLMQAALEILKNLPKAELLWASPRELLNVIQANDVGCHIITATNDVLNKLSLVGKDLEEYSLDTVKMFYRDALAAGYQITEAEEAL